MLEINNLTIVREGITLCMGQRMHIKGICAVIGQHSLLHESVRSLFSTSRSHYVEDLKILLDIKYKDELITYREFRLLMNQYNIFNEKDTVENIFNFIDIDNTENIIRTFDLEPIRQTEVGMITFKLSKNFELAIFKISKSKIIYIPRLPESTEDTMLYIRKLKEIFTDPDIIFLIETDLLDTNKYDSYLMINETTLESYIPNIQNRCPYAEKLYFADFIARNCVDRYNDIAVINCEIDTFGFIDVKSEIQTEYRSGRHITSTFFNKIKKYSYKKYVDFRRRIKYVFCIKPDIDMILRLTNLKMTRKGYDEAIKRYYFNISFVSLIGFIYKHVYSLHLIALYILVYIGMGSDLNIGIKKNCLLETACIFMNECMKNVPCTLLDRYMKYRKLNNVFDPLKILYNEYHEVTSIGAYKVISSMIYFLIFCKTFLLFNHDYYFVKRHLFLTFTPFNYFIHYLVYVFVTVILPLLFMALILNIRHLYLFILNGFFISPLFSCYRRPKIKIGMITFIIAYNFIYPIPEEKFMRIQIVDKISLYEPFGICRSGYTNGITIGSYGKLIAYYLCTYVFFCLLIPAAK